MDKLPCIPMTKYHQQLILDGRKTTTLRAKRFEPGVYRMFSRGAGSLGHLRVTRIKTFMLIPSWVQSDNPEDWQALVKSEGYDSSDEFLVAMRKLRLDPNKAYWLHEITLEEDLRDGA